MLLEDRKRCRIEGLMVWFVRRGEKCARVDVEAWWGVRRRMVYESVMESPWLCGSALLINS